MPIYPVNNLKMVVLNEDKSRGLIVEYPQTMGFGEVLDRINEFRATLIKSIEEEAAKANEKKEETPAVEATVEASK